MAKLRISEGVCVCVLVFMSPSDHSNILVEPQEYSVDASAVRYLQYTSRLAQVVALLMLHSFSAGFTMALPSAFSGRKCSNAQSRAGSDSGAYV